MRVQVGLMWAMALLGCKPAAKANPDSGAAKALLGSEPNAPAPIQVTPGRADLVFSYQDETGKFHDVSRPEDVPGPFKKAVLVRDLSLKPEDVQADRMLYVADLTATPEDGGSYPYALVSRYRFKLPEVLLDGDGGVIENGVVMYGTSWCGACAGARKFFQSQHIPYIDHDIEKEPDAAAELARKAKRAGRDFRGVPVIDVRGELMEGFDPGAVMRALHGG
jgi:glutaredoxin